MTKEQGGHRATHISLLHGRLCQQVLCQEPGALYRGEQGKILASFWQTGGQQTATDIAHYTGLANSSLTTMLKRLEDQGLLVSAPCPDDKRKKLYRLTEKGQDQEAIGRRVDQAVASIFYDGFSEEEIETFIAYQKRILANLRRGLEGRDMACEEPENVD